MNFKILRELQKNDEEITNLDCNECFQLFNQITTTNTTLYVLVKTKDKKKQRNWIKKMANEKQKRLCNLH